MKIHRVRYKNGRPYVQYGDYKCYGQIRICLDCNEKFFAPDKNIKKGWGKFCSWNCRSKLKNNGHWKNGTSFTKEGYKKIMLISHPLRDRHNYILEHRFIVEKQIGRYLHKREYVHHINRTKDDNRPENLMAFINQSAHKRFEQGGKIKVDEIIFDGRKEKVF